MTGPRIALGLCHCGCGGATSVSPRNNAKLGHVKGQPYRYLAGHQPKKRRENHPDWRGGRKEMGGYVGLLMPDHPHALKNGYVTEHVYLASRALGKPLPPQAEVHHVDRNRANNTTTNLVVCENIAYHRLLHRRQRALDACGNPNALPCRFCGGYDRQDEMDFVERKPSGTHKTPTTAAHHRDCQRAYDKGRKRSAKRLDVALATRGVDL